MTAPRKWSPGPVPQCNSAAGFPRHEDVEAALREHPAIDDAVVLDVDGGGLGHQVVAVWSWVEGHNDTVDSVLAAVRSRTVADEVPNSVIVVDAVPHTSVGTVDRRTTRQIVSIARLLRTSIPHPHRAVTE